MLKNAKIKKTATKIKNPLAGAIYIAIEKAERFKTSLVIKEDGEIKHISPAEMRKRLKSAS